MLEIKAGTEKKHKQSSRSKKRKKCDEDELASWHGDAQICWPTLDRPGHPSMPSEGLKKPVHKKMNNINTHVFFRGQATFNTIALG